MAMNNSSSLCLRCSLRSYTLSNKSMYFRRAIFASHKISSIRRASTATASKFSSQHTAPASISQTTKPNPTLTPTKPAPTSTAKSIAQEIRNIAPSFTETYVAYGVCEELIKECVRVADYTIPQASDLNAEIPKNDKGEDVGIGESWWYKGLGLTPTFNTWAQISFLHMYLLTVRLRCFPPEHAPIWHQHLTDHFFQLAEDRMVLLHRLNSRMIRNKYLKDLYVQWRGLTAAYDEGIMKGDAVLAAAVWRNVCKGDENVDLQRLTEVVSYIRSVLASFDTMSDQVLAQGDVVFGDPSSEAPVVSAPSSMLNAITQPEFTKAPAKVVQKL